MEKPIQVLVANRPQLMRELILATLTDQPGIEIVGEVTEEMEIPGRVNETLPDVLVLALDEPGRRPDICGAILHAHPGVRILALAFGQNRAICYWASVDIHSDDIESSAAGILNAVRKIAAGVGGVS